MIYTKESIDHPLFQYFKQIKDAKLEPNSVYWHDKHDYHIRGISLDDFLDAEHWEHLRQDPTSKILFYYGDEYFNLSDVDMYATTIKTKNVNTSQIYFIVIDSTWCKWIITEFEKRGITGINVIAHNLLLKKTMKAISTPLQIIENSTKKFLMKKKVPKVKKKFSAFSRRFDHWRLQLFIELLLNNLLPNFQYTFNNIDPYVGIGINNIARVFEKDEILEILASKNYDLTRVENWISDVPYTFPELSPFDKWTTHAHKWIKESAIHLLVESHYDPFNNFEKYKKQYGIKEFAPSLITEKTWKVISSSRPFIVFATPYFLEDLKLLGFQTFHPHINEAYDTIENENDRMFAIVNEIDRLNNLSADEFDSVFKECYNIALENYKIFQKLHAEIKFKDEFKWVNAFLKKGD
jgi:hypothetical protein